GAVVVIAVADPVETDGIDRIAEHVFERAVGAAVPGDFGVAVVFAALVLIYLAAGVKRVVAHPLDGVVFGLDRGRERVAASAMSNQFRRGRRARQIDDAG